MTDRLVKNPGFTLVYSISEQGGLDLGCEARRRYRPIERRFVYTEPELDLLQKLDTIQPGSTLIGDLSSKQIACAQQWGALVSPDEVPLSLRHFQPRLDQPLAVDGAAPLGPCSNEYDTLNEAPQSVPLSVNQDVYWQEGSSLPPAIRKASRYWDTVPEQGGGGGFSDARPLMWVRYPGIGLFFPLWPGTLYHEAKALLEGDLSPEKLSAERRLRYSSCGLLAPKSALNPLVSSYEPLLPKTPQPSDVIELPQIFPAFFMTAYRAYFDALNAHGLFTRDDNQITGIRYGLYGDQVLTWFQHQLSHFLNQRFGLSVKPSYCWAMQYLGGAALPMHTDRKQCLWNLSLSIGENSDKGHQPAWPLWFDTLSGHRPVHLSSGDGVLYSGTNTTHWRNPLAADRTVAMAFLHYVSKDFDGPLT